MRVRPARRPPASAAAITAAERLGREVYAAASNGRTPEDLVALVRGHGATDVTDRRLPSLFRETPRMLTFKLPESDLWVRVAYGAEHPSVEIETHGADGLAMSTMRFLELTMNRAGVEEHRRVFDYDATGRLLRESVNKPNGETDENVINAPVRPLEEIYSAKTALDRHRLATAARTDRELVAIFDTGVDYNAPELAYRIPRLAGQPIGLDLAEDDDEPFDASWEVTSRKHGTAVAFRASRDDDDIAILPIRTGMHPCDFERGVAFAYARGARLVNISAQGVAFAGAAEVMRRYPDVLFVVAAGNKGNSMDNRRNVDQYPIHPVSVRLPNVLVVTAVDREGKLPEYANYGPLSVHVAAQGHDVEVLEPGGMRVRRDGTSFAAPEVIRLAARLRRRDRSKTPESLRKTIENTVDFAEHLRGVVSTGGIVNEDRALAAVR